MARRNRVYTNRVAEGLLQMVYWLFPVGCAALAAYDIWSNGWQSPLLQIAVGILTVYVLVRSTIRACLMIDDAMNAWCLAARWVGPKAASCRNRLVAGRG